MRRFYQTVTVIKQAHDYQITLDERPVKTPNKALLGVPSRKLADAIAAEWHSQRDEIAPATMPMMALATTAIDHVIPNRKTVITGLVDYGASDLLCYRAPYPALLVERQKQAWQPLLDWANSALGVSLNVVSGVMFQKQPDDSMARLKEIISSYNPYDLVVLNELTSNTGSLIAALAVVNGYKNAKQIHAISRVDTDYQAEYWGKDYAATERQAEILMALTQAEQFYQLVQDQ